MNPCGFTTLDDGVWASDPGPDQRWGQPQFVLQNLWQIRVNQHHLLPIWTTWWSYSGCDRPWPVGASQVVSRLIKVAFYCIFLTDFSGKWHRRRNGLEIGENPPDLILNSLLVPAEGSWPLLQGLGWRPGARASNRGPRPAMGQPQFVLQKSWTNSQIPSLKMTLPATDPKTTTTELKPAIFQFILPLKSSDGLVDGAGAGRLK